MIAPRTPGESMANRSKEEAHDVLLDAALEIFVENLGTTESLHAALSSVAFAEMAARAGYKGPGIAYYVWDQTGGRSASRRAFEGELLERIIEVGALNVGVEVDENLDLGPTDLQLLALTDAVGRSTWDASCDNPTTILWEMLTMLRDVEAVGTPWAQAEVAAMDELVAIIDGLVGPLQRRFRPGFSAREFVVAARALLPTLIGTAELNPDYANYYDHYVEGRDEPVSLYGFCLFAMIDHMTEPAPAE